jgi:tetratricopeptide (TPR) repeat protein
MTLQSLVKIINYGQFSRPFLNYIVDNLENVSTKQCEEIIDYIDVLKLKWDEKYEEALEKIEEGIKGLSKGGLYYLFLEQKMIILKRLNDVKEVEVIYKELRDNFEKIPIYVRGLVVESLRNIRELYYESNESMEKIRYWSEVYENNPVDKGFIFMADAREKKNEGKYEEATQLNIKAFKILKDVPHPSGNGRIIK